MTRLRRGDYRSAGPSTAQSEYGDDNRGAKFAVPSGRAPRVKKQPLGAPGVAKGSVASQDDKGRGRSRSASRDRDSRKEDKDSCKEDKDSRKDEPEEMDVNGVSKHSKTKTHRSRKTRRSSKKSRQRRRSPSMSADDRGASPAVSSDRGRLRCSRSTRWDVPPMIPIPLVEPRRDLTRELEKGRSAGGLVSRRPEMDPEQEQIQTAERDRHVQEEQGRQIWAGTAMQPVFLPHLQALIMMMQSQLPHIVDEVRTKPVDELLKKST